MPKAQEKEPEQKPVSKRESVTLEIQHGKPAGPAAGTRRTFSREQHGDEFETHAKNWKERFDADEVAE